MRLAKLVREGAAETVGVVEGEVVRPLRLGGAYTSLADILAAPDPAGVAADLSDGAEVPLSQVQLLAPIDLQEVWAAGVTYTRSKSARMEESEGGGDFYDRVYDAERPELFLKATPSRVVGPGEAVRIRRDSRWNVPEPELTLVLSPSLRLVGFTVGNDMSSRDIEGANPLYLPQAKVYDACCALGPWVVLAAAAPPLESMQIELVIRRGGAVAFQDSIGVDQLHRSLDNLIDHLGRDNSFPHGVFLLTGTGIVPEGDFTLLPGDEVFITIDGVGTLTNHVVQGE